MTNNYISIDLNDSRTKSIAEIISNESCKKILNLLAEKELTETEISHELKMPLNSVDYNIKKLAKVGLIESSKHWWSTRGKKIPAYKIADKKIIISPKKTLNNFIIPTIMTGVIAVLGVKKYFTQTTNELLMRAPSTELYASKAVQDAAGTSLANVAEQTVSSGFFSSLSGWEWLILGIWLGSVLFFVLNYISERKSNG